MSRPLRILHVTEACGGGVARHLQLVGAELRELDCRNRLFAFSGRADDFFQAQMERVFPECDFLRLASVNPLPHFHGITRRLRAAVDSFRPEIIHLHSSWAGLFGRLALYGTAPLVYSPHAFAWTGRNRLRDCLVRSAETLLARRTAAFVFVGQPECDLAARWRLPAEKLHLAANALDDGFARRLLDRDDARARLQLPEGRRAVLFAGRPVWQKGFDALLEACRGMDAVQVTVHVFANATCPAGAPVVVHPPRPDYDSLLRAFDAAILPSRYEGLPYAALECLAAGLPLWTTATGLPPSSLLHPLRDITPASLKQAILDDRPKPDAQALKPARTSRQQAEEIIRVYRQIL